MIEETWFMRGANLKYLLIRKSVLELWTDTY